VWVARSMVCPLDPLYICGLAPALVAGHEALHYLAARMMGDRPKVFRTGINVGVITHLEGRRLAAAALAPQLLTAAAIALAMMTPAKWLLVLATANVVASIRDLRLAIKALRG